MKENQGKSRRRFGIKFVHFNSLGVGGGGSNRIQFHPKTKFRFTIGGS